MRCKFDYSGYEVLVTGGSNGIGLAIAQGFADAGATVTVTGTRTGTSDYTTDLSRFEYLQAEMDDPLSIDALISATTNLDILVNNAGTFVPPPDGLTPAGFEKNMAINLNSVFRLCQGLHEKLRIRPGSIVNIASMYSYFGPPTGPAYGASKAAIVNLTKSLAGLYAADGLRVNAIAPGWIRTNLTAKTQADDERNRKIMDRTPLKRWGRAEELVGTALYLASDRLAGFVTGATIPVDGGYSAA